MSLLSASTFNIVKLIVLQMMNLRLIGVKGGGKSICSCGYSSQRYWTNDSSSNIFPAKIADFFCTESEAAGA